MPFMLHFGFGTMSKFTSDLKATSKDTVSALLDKAKQTLTERFPESLAAPAAAPPPSAAAASTDFDMPAPSASKSAAAGKTAAAAKSGGVRDSNDAAKRPTTAPPKAGAAGKNTGKTESDPDIATPAASKSSAGAKGAKVATPKGAEQVSADYTEYSHVLLTNYAPDFVHEYILYNTVYGTPSTRTV